MALGRGFPPERDNMMTLKARNLIRILLSIAIIGVFSGLYYIWLGNFRNTHPEITRVQPYCFCTEIPLDGVLMWEEEVIFSPFPGKVSYPGGLKPSRVAKGQLLAVIVSGVGKQRIYAPFPCYFVPGLDGKEGLWDYTSLWLGSAALPGEGDFTFFPEGMQVKSKAPIGKVIPLPQDLRLVGYADSHPDLLRDAEKGYLDIKTDPLELPWKSQVRVYRKYGHRVKFYLSLPFFPPQVLLSRKVSYYIYTGERFGASIPETALTLRQGRSGVFRLKGNMVSFYPVEGIPLPEGRIFVEKGLQPGDLILEKAHEAREGRIRFW